MSKQAQTPRVIQAIATSDGAGVTLKRSIGTQALKNLDPFLMLDHFSSDNPDDYLAGFPPHPHRGFITFTYMIEGDRYDANPTGLALVRTTSCGGGVFINMTGDPMPGNTLNFSLTATSQLAGFAFGPEPSISLPGCSCIIGVSSVLSTIGNTTIINLPMNSSLIGARLSTQAWMLGATGTSCLANIHLSDTLDIIVR